MKDLKELRKSYENIPIPDELETMIREAFPKKKSSHRLIKWSVGVAATIMLLVGSLNVSPALANQLAAIPVVGEIVKVLTFRTYQLDEGTYQANIETPAVEGLRNQGLEQGLNDKYLAESERLFSEFNEEIEKLKAEGGGYLGIDSGFEVKTDNEQLLSIGRYVVNTVGSSSTIVQYDTVDKQKQLLITLPSLFKNDQYVDIISRNIRKQMKEQMVADENIAYFIDDEFGADFEKISKTQNFYISNEGKLIISFDKV